MWTRQDPMTHWPQPPVHARPAQRKYGRESLGLPTTVALPVVHPPATYEHSRLAPLPVTPYRLAPHNARTVSSDLVQAREIPPLVSGGRLTDDNHRKHDLRTVVDVTQAGRVTQFVQNKSLQA